jgi:hypothetical protein
VLIRYLVHDPWLLRFTKKTKTTIGFIHHSIEEIELRAEGGFLSTLRYWLEKKIGPRVLGRAKILIGVTPEILKHQLGRNKKNDVIGFTYPNGGAVEKHIPEDRRGVVPEFIFIASAFHSSHGLDLLLYEMQSCSDHFILNVVGSALKQDIILAKKDTRVILHGVLSPLQVKNLASSAWVAFSSFAPERKGIKQGVPLKTRECLGWGIPVYGKNEEVFPKEFAFYRRGALSLPAILDFANECRKISRKEVVNESYLLINKADILKKLYIEIFIFSNNNYYT